MTVAKVIEAPDIIDMLNYHGLTNRDIGRALGVSDRAVRRWKQNSISNQRYEVLADMRDIVAILEDSLTPRGVGQWFHARSRILDGARPLDAIADGRVEEVLAAADAFDQGIYI